MRIFNAFMIIIASVMLWLLPITTAIYSFRTDVREDTFTSPTAVGVTAANVTLGKPIYDDDTGTLDISSNLTGDLPAYSTYNTTSRLLEVSGLTANTTRLLTVSYDIDALTSNAAISTLMDYFPYLWIMCIVGFPMMALFAIITGRA